MAITKSKAKQEVEVLPSREQLLAGHRELIDFLEAHPEVPLPAASLYLSYGYKVDFEAAIAALLEDDTVISAETHSKDYAFFTRMFGKLSVRVSCRSEQVGVYSPPKFTPHTVAAIRAKAEAKALDS